MTRYADRPRKDCPATTLSHPEFAAAAYVPPPLASRRESVGYDDRAVGAIRLFLPAADSIRMRRPPPPGPSTSLSRVREVALVAPERRGRPGLSELPAWSARPTAPTWCSRRARGSDRPELLRDRPAVEGRPAGLFWSTSPARRRCRAERASPPPLLLGIPQLRYGPASMSHQCQIAVERLGSGARPSCSSRRSRAGSDLGAPARASERLSLVIPTRRGSSREATADRQDFEPTRGVGRLLTYAHAPGRLLLRGTRCHPVGRMGAGAGPAP